jgi:hypothetical protein
MGLHDALNPEIVWVWRFYTAINERRGRSHLLHVPLVKRLIIHPPRWLYNERERDEWIENERRQGDLWSAPSYVFLGHQRLDKFCNRVQRADHYSTEHDWNGYRHWEAGKRGICQPCWNHALTLPEKKTMGPVSFDYWHNTAGIRTNTDLKEWLREAQGYRNE